MCRARRGRQPREALSPRSSADPIRATRSALRSAPHFPEGRGGRARAGLGPALAESTDAAPKPAFSGPSVEAPAAGEAADQQNDEHDDQDDPKQEGLLGFGSRRDNARGSL